MAYAIARTPYPWRNLLLLLVILPFWTSFLLRVYAWMVMLGKQGLINNMLMSVGVIDKPLQMLYTDGAVYLGIVYTYVPFMILPLYATLERLNPDLHEAAADLGARPRQVFRDVTLPLAMPGIIAGCLLVFIPALGEYVIPALLGGLDSLMIGRTLYDEFFRQPGLASGLCCGCGAPDDPDTAHHAVPAPAAGGGHMRRLLHFPVLNAVLRLRVLISAHPGTDDLLLQRRTPGDRMGRLLYPLVQRPAGE